MIIRSTRPESNFYLLDKRISEDKKLSWASRGLLIFLLGKPDNWRVSAEFLAQQTTESSKKTGKQGVYSLLDELIVAGYVVRSDKQAHDEKTGFLLGYDYVVYDSPCHPQPYKAEPYKAEPYKAEPYKAEPYKANHPLISIDTNQGLNLTSIDTNQGLNKSFSVAEKEREECFNFFWLQYPTKTNKQAAVKAWLKLKMDESLYQQIMVAVAKQKNWQQWQEGYIPHAATWLNGKRWEDVEPVRKNNGGGGDMAQYIRETSERLRKQDGQSPIFDDSFLIEDSSHE